MAFLQPSALKIYQPLSDFYVVKIKARDLLKISFSEELEYVDENGRLRGSQRKTDDKRLHEIARYIDSIEMSFPNSIILAANYTPQGEVLDVNSNERWQILDNGDDLYKILIPTDKPLAAIIDGQHRLKAFKYATKSERLDLEILCSVFFDLPNSYQAFLFATINGNQKRVDKSLALEQFGFNVEDEPPKSWTPEKLAVYFSRKLNIDNSSPLHNHIKVAPKDDKGLVRKIGGTWVVSTAIIVEGILSLISSKPKRDRVEMGQESIFGGRSRKMLKEFKDSAPLRELYLDNNDDKIYNIIQQFFLSCNEVLFNSGKENSYLFKTVGIQALFDLLRNILAKEGIKESYSFAKYITPIRNINFSDNYFQTSDVGRQRIRNLLLFANGLISPNSLKESELNEFHRLLGISNKQ